MQYDIEMKNIHKEFPGVVANDDITLQVEKGEIHALLGENGAGKSTLMNILFGLYQPDRGEIYVKGDKVSIDDANVANRLGIGMVHQHFMLIKTFTVAENIILGKEPKKGMFVDRKQAIKDIEEISEQYGLSVDPRAKMKDISVGMQQRVEIIKTLYRGADILILDEPTAILTPQEVEELMEIMRKLAAEGKSIVLITHKLKEIMEVANRVTVIRGGSSIDTMAIDDADSEQLAQMMVGREVSLTVDRRQAHPGHNVLDIENLKVKDDRKVQIVNDLSLSVRSGEIVGVAGVDGNGQAEMIEAITGMRKATDGRVFIGGNETTSMKTRNIFEQGIGHIPQDRHRHGLVLDFTIAENMILHSFYRKPYSKAGILQDDVIHEEADELIEKYDVRTPSADQYAQVLSGGNQQKAIIAREIESSEKLLIAAQPTRGVDIGAIEFIHQQLVEERDQGKGVLLVSYELDEILQLSDRIAVIFNGEIIKEVDPKDTDQFELGMLMAGHSGSESKQSNSGSAHSDHEGGE